MDDDELPPAEEARDKRRDRRVQGAERELMRTGSAKVFKQILDVQERRAHETVDEEAEAGEGGRTDRRRGRGHESGHGHGHGADGDR
jgi:hypothetical protein